MLYFVFIVWRSTHRQFFYSPIRRAWAISTGFFLDFCAKVKEETGAYSAGPHYGRIKKLPVRISVGTAKQCRLLFNFSSIFKGKKQQFDAIFLLRVHALLRDPLRGGRDHFTEIKFNEIRSRCAEFGEFLAKVARFEGFSRFVFHLIFKICCKL